MTINQIVKMLRNMFNEMCSYYSAHTRPSDKWTSILFKSLEELEKQQWISVTDYLPKNEETVLICAEVIYNGNIINKKQTLAFHTDGKHTTEDSRYYWNDDTFEYNETEDASVIPEGWWRVPHYTNTLNIVDDFVTHWMKLPEPPDNNDN